MPDEINARFLIPQETHFAINDGIDHIIGASSRWKDVERPNGILARALNNAWRHAGNQGQRHTAAAVNILQRATPAVKDAV